MATRSGLKDLPWMAGGTVLLIAFVLLALHYHRQEDSAQRAVFMAGRLELIATMRSALSSSSEAEKSAVMATTDLESRSLAEQARAASAVVAQNRDSLVKLLETGGTRQERELLSEFSLDLAECQRIDRELLDLAVRNTNLKAYALAFGPAHDALTGMDGALSKILMKCVTSNDPDARRAMLLAAAAQSGAWRIQSLLPPHISEEKDQRMDEFEERMTTEDRSVRSNLKALAGILGSGSPELDAATSGYARFSELRTQILDLSRQNTNVRSWILSLNQKRKAVEVCQNALAALEQAIRSESLAEKPPIRPR